MAQTQAKRVYLQNENDEILLPYSAQALEDGEGNVITDTYAKIADIPSLTGKANTDFTNVSTTGKSTASGWGMPSENAITLSAGASGSTYTAPANGWFRANGTSTASGHLSIFRSLDDFSLNVAVAWGAGMSLISACPVKKGQVVTLGYSNASIIEFKFFYAEGDVPTESEA